MKGVVMETLFACLLFAMIFFGSSALLVIAMMIERKK